MSFCLIFVDIFLHDIDIGINLSCVKLYRVVFELVMLAQCKHPSFILKNSNASQIAVCGVLALIINLVDFQWEFQRRLFASESSDNF